MVFSCPLPGTYAVVELDIENTLKSLDDPVALAEGARITTTKCIVYLHIVLQLPVPDCETFKYMVFLIGPGLRPEVPERCITSDMCMPIFPNTSYPADSLVRFRDDIQLIRHPFLSVREPLRTEPEFPFSNCCHWFCDRTTLDLRILNEGTDYRAMKHVELPADQHCRMVVFQERDHWRASLARQEMNPIPVSDLEPGPEPPAEASECPDRPEESTRSPVDCAEDETMLFTSSAPGAMDDADDNVGGVSENDSSSDDYDNDECKPDSEYYESCSEYGYDYESDYDRRSYASYDSDGSEGSYGPAEEAQRLASMDIFGFSLQEQELLMPVCKLWLDIGAHFTEDTIPNPMEFVEQYDELTRIVRESRERARARTCLAIEVEDKPAPCIADDSACMSNAGSTVSGHALSQPQSEDGAADKQSEGALSTVQEVGNSAAASDELNVSAPLPRALTCSTAPTIPVFSPWSTFKKSILSVLHCIFTQ